MKNRGLFLSALAVITAAMMLTAGPVDKAKAAGAEVGSRAGADAGSRAGDKVGGQTGKAVQAADKIKPQNQVIRRALPDLVVWDIGFDVVRMYKNPGGDPYQLFNVTVIVKNVGRGASMPCTALLERNVGPGGGWVDGCPSCRIDVAALAPGEVVRLSPRQFNNRNLPDLAFRATVDSQGQVAEQREGNNQRDEEYRMRVKGGSVGKN